MNDEEILKIVEQEKDLLKVIKDKKKELMENDRFMTLIDDKDFLSFVEKYDRDTSLKVIDKYNELYSEE